MRTYNAYVEQCIEAQQGDGYLEAELMADACTRECRFGVPAPDIPHVDRGTAT